MLSVMAQWEHGLLAQQKSSLESIFPSVLMTRRWFGGKARKIQAVRILESVPCTAGGGTAVFLFLRVEYQEGPPETYIMPISAAFGEKAAHIRRELPHAVVAPFAFQGQEGIFYEAVWDVEYSSWLLGAVGREERFGGDAGTLIFSATEAYHDLVGNADAVTPDVMKGEQSNTSIAYDERVILKLYRRLQDGLNPDLEIGRALTSMHFPYSPRVGGGIEYSRPGEEPATVAILQGFVRNHGDAWKVTVEAFGQFLMRIAGKPMEQDRASLLSPTPLWQLADKEPPPLARESIGAYLESAELLGQRTAELHVALASCTDNPAFKPEPLSKAYRADRYESMCRLTEKTLALLKARAHEVHSTTELAQHVLKAESEIKDRFHAFRELDSTALRIRCHGDYHLGQVLWTGEKFVVVDFEGEPARPLRERRLKHPPIMDVAGMLRSFHYVPHAWLVGQQTDPHGKISRESIEPAMAFWYRWVSALFLKGYKRMVVDAPFWPQADNEVEVLLHAYLLEKAVYELLYELNNRPDWSSIPLRGIVELLKQAS